MAQGLGLRVYGVGFGVQGLNVELALEFFHCLFVPLL